jgi:hypothetical protein
MPVAPDSSIIGRVGVFYTGYICALAGLLFREVTISDVGVDGQIELVDDEKRATGMLAGVQIKSGDSFVDVKRKTFTFRAEPKHFEYWKRYCLPVFGVVFSPTLKKAVWFDLNKHLSRIIEEGGPYQVTEGLSQSNEFNVQNVSTTLTNIIKEYHGIPVSTENVNKVVELQDLSGKEAEEQLSRETAWKRLTTMFLSSQSSPEVLAEIGYRISWYFPAVSENQQNFFIERIAQVSDQQLINIIGAIHAALLRERTDVADLICDLIAYLPDKVNRLKSLAKSGKVPPDYLEANFQVIEGFTQNFESEFRAEVSTQYKLNQS